MGGQLVLIASCSHLEIPGSRFLSHQGHPAKANGFASGLMIDAVTLLNPTPSTWKALVNNEGLKAEVQETLTVEYRAE